MYTCVAYNRVLIAIPADVVGLPTNGASDGGNSEWTTVTAIRTSERLRCATLGEGVLEF